MYIDTYVHTYMHYLKPDFLAAECVVLGPLGGWKAVAGSIQKRARMDSVALFQDVTAFFRGSIGGFRVEG